MALSRRHRIRQMFVDASRETTVNKTPEEGLESLKFSERAGQPAHEPAASMQRCPEPRAARHPTGTAANAKAGLCFETLLVRDGYLNRLLLRSRSL